MDFFKLDGRFQPEDLIENRLTTIWTERYKENGDFTITSGDIAQTMKSLPLGCLVAIKESPEIMFVETHEINEDADGQEILTVSGRSFETFFENRTTLLGKTPINDSSNEANEISIENSTATDAVLSIINTAKISPVDPLDNIPSSILKVISSVLRNQGLADRAIERGPAYAAFFKILDENNLGIKNIRPSLKSTAIIMEIYDGEDRSEEVILDARADHFDSTKHLWSNKGYKTAVYTSSARHFAQVKRAGTSTFTGLDRRVGLVDTSTITKTGTKYLNQTKTKGTQYLNVHEMTTIFEGLVSPDIPFKFNKHYGLGDLVLCVGKYGVKEKLRVSEYIRTEDDDGEKGYPSLTRIKETAFESE